MMGCAWRVAYVGLDLIKTIKKKNRAWRVMHVELCTMGATFGYVTSTRQCYYVFHV